MKSSIRTFILAAIAASIIAASTHSASAQMAFAANAVTTEHTLPYEGVGTINAIVLPKAGTYVFGGQQSLIATSVTAATPVFCWTTSQAGSTTPLPYGPLSMTTIMPPGGYITLPLSGYYTATAPTEIWVECEYFGDAAVVSQITGTITATQVK